MYRFMDRLARLFALLGGIVLSTLIVMTCLSIIGRSMNAMLHSDLLQGAVPGLASALLATGVGPINGDFELVEAGMAFTIFAFLPLCQLRGAHASVDIFTQMLPIGFNRILRALIEAIFAAVLVIIAWELSQGMLSKQRSGQTTFLLAFPLWWAYALSLTGAVVAAVVAVYLAALRIVEGVTGRNVLPSEMEAEH